MPTDHKQGDAANLLDDIHFVNQAASKEIRHVESRLRERIGDEALPENLAAPLLEEISTQLGQLAAKVKLTEKAIHSLQSRQKNKTKAGNNIAVAPGTKQAGISFPANALAGTGNLLPLETASNGISYCWTGADPETGFSFALDRSKKLEMQIRLFALIKPEYSKQLKVIIDGAHVKHRFTLDGSLFVVSCRLPVSATTSQTTVSIILPATHCPTDLGGGLDGRTLGIAISDIHFGKPTSRLTHLLRRLRIKK